MRLWTGKWCGIGPQQAICSLPETAPTMVTAKPVGNICPVAKAAPIGSYDTMKQADVYFGVDPLIFSLLLRLESILGCGI